MKKIFAFLSATLICLAFSEVAFAEPTLEYGEVNPDYIEYWNMSEEEREDKLMPRRTVPKSTPSVSTYSRSMLSASTLPDTYDLRDSDDVSSVKDQGSRGSCWTFTSLAVLESYFLKVHNITYDFSELHMDYATSMYCPGGALYTEGITNNSGFDKYAGTGGNIDFSMPYLFSEKGAVNESAMPYNEASGRIALSTVTNAASANVWVKDYAVLPSINVADGVTSIDEYIVKVKEHIMNYGAMDVTMKVGTSFNRSTIAFYNASNTAEDTDHAVTVVGWDDNYLASDFTPDKPSRNGAWIIKNSWGTGANDGGYFYMSYEDMSFYQVNAGIRSASSSKSYDKVYSYDDFGHNAYLGSGSVNTIYGMNIFEADESGQVLESVTVGLHVPASFEVYVNTDGGIDDVANMEKVADGRFDYEGYKTVDLSSPVILNGGPFAVVVKYTCDSGAWMPVEGKDSQFYKNVTANAGESYYSWNGTTWKDIQMSGGTPANCSIKAFVTDPAPNTIVYPGSIKATAISNTEIKITWNAVTDATKYDVYMSTSPNGTYNFLGTATTTSYTHTGVQNGITYYYKVKAYKNYNGSPVESSLSPYVNASPLAAPSLTGLSVSGGGNINQTVTLTANVSGYATGVKYRFTWSHSNGQSGVVREYAAGNTVAFKLAVSGTYTFQVQAQMPNGTVETRTASFNCVDPYSFTITNVTVPAQANAGQTISIKANTSGNISGLQYKFSWSLSGGTGGVIRNYAAGNTVNFTLPSAGIYTFNVEVKSTDGKVQNKSVTMTAADPSNFNITKVNVPGTGWAGQTITISANVSGNTSGLKYKFVWSCNNWSSWGVIRNFGNGNSVTFKLPSQGKYDFYVDVMATNGKVVTKSAASTIMPASYFSVNKVNAPSSGNAGQTVSLSANVSGNTTGLKYKFVWSYNNWSQWGVIRNFSATNAASFKLQYPGKYDFYIDVMGTNGQIITKFGTVNALDKYDFSVDSVSVPSSGNVGQWVTVKANTSGYTTGLKYKFVWSYNNWSQWGVARNFGVGDTESIQLKYPGRYDFYVDVMGANGKIITKSAASTVYLGWNVNGINAESTWVKRGNSVNLTGSVSGGSDLKYKFVWCKDNWQNWGVIKQFDLSNSTVFTPSSIGTYVIYMDVIDSFGNVKTVTRFIIVY